MDGVCPVAGAPEHLSGESYWALDHGWPQGISHLLGQMKFSASGHSVCVFGLETGKGEKSSSHSFPPQMPKLSRAELI